MNGLSATSTDSSEDAISIGHSDSVNMNNVPTEAKGKRPLHVSKERRACVFRYRLCEKIKREYIKCERIKREIIVRDLSKMWNHFEP